ncbi:hypothetical protein J2Y73_001837 [Peribacillus frigoritolerans]|uniref:hypothetical protein n=1 Tax=Peribacillus frigoritolerans TaxID=450367 RepID=UPI00209F2AD5|nr:hypothetical protein [Peribacillus frigoritolerans]MCP1491806.1 hypothetical protein [Peribacillus frigoritolerans]
MSNLKKGELEIDGVFIFPNCKLDDIKTKESSSMFKSITLDSHNKSLRFLNAPKLGRKYFNVRLSFKNNLISGINLKVNNPSINQWDYEEKLSQHGEWLTEQIGYPEGILSENVFEWGKITQWYDPRSCDAGISILYFQR